MFDRLLKIIFYRLLKNILHALPVWMEWKKRDFKSCGVFPGFVAITVEEIKGGVWMAEPTVSN